MHIFDLTGDEWDPVYQAVAASNRQRHYGFLNSMIEASLQLQHRDLSHSLIKSINFHAIAGLHRQAGRYRTTNIPVWTWLPPHEDVKPLMNLLVDNVNSLWDATPAVELASFALWAINRIHPFVNGNGRTARAICYFIFCVKIGGVLPGNVTLMEYLRTQPLRETYVEALRSADRGDFGPINDVVQLAIRKQVQSANA